MSSRALSAAACVAASLMLAHSLTAQVIDRGKVQAGRSNPDITLLIQQYGHSDVVQEKWVRNYTETAPTPVRFRWSTTLGNVTSARWQVSKSEKDFSQPVAQGATAVPPAGQSRDFEIDFRHVAGATQLPQTYWVRIVVNPGGSTQRAVPPVRVNFVEGETTQFTAEGLYPELLKPMPVFVNLSNFEIVKADEENDEEPYIVPVVLYLDGTTIDIMNRPSSTVRVVTSQRHDVHGNIPRYNGHIGSGDNIAVPGDVGYFESTILPLNLNLADTNLLGFQVDWTHLVKATTVWIGVLAVEQDDTGDGPANAARDAFVQGLKAEMENCLRAMAFKDVVDLLKNGQNVNAMLTSDDSSACGYSASEENGSVLDQIRARLEHLATSAGTGEAVDEFVNHYVPGTEVLLIKQIARPDEVVGFDFRTFTYRQLMDASGPIKFTLDFDLIAGPSGLRAGKKTIHYTLDGQIGRCVKDPTKSQCVPTYAPLLSR